MTNPDDPTSNNRDKSRILKNEKTCDCLNATNANPTRQISNLTYFILLFVTAIFWLAIYLHVEAFANWLVYGLLGILPLSHMGQALEFFFYDTVKILLLLIALIYLIAWLRASLSLERVRTYLTKKKRLLGYLLGALFGSVTPFCSCSSIPLFLGFTTAQIPFGITMAFLITSPLINEIAIVLLWGLLGWKFTIIYIVVGILVGIGGGMFMDAIKAERWLQPFILDLAKKPILMPNQVGAPKKLTIYQRHVFAWGEMRSIFGLVWIWVLVGLGIGSIMHGYVPDNWFAENLAGEWWTVPIASLVAIPLYSNVTGIVPVMESLLSKGLPIGTTLAFCMSAVAASIPEVMLLRQIMTIKLQATFIVFLWLAFTIIGWLFNYIGPAINNS